MKPLLLSTDIAPTLFNIYIYIFSMHSVRRILPVFTDLEPMAYDLGQLGPGAVIMNEMTVARHESGLRFRRGWASLEFENIWLYSIYSILYSTIFGYMGYLPDAKCMPCAKHQATKH